MNRFPLIYFIPMLLCMGCSSANEFAGSFEESRESGRVDAIDSASGFTDTPRFFRFHLKQFDEDIGGTFETFDMSSFSMFEQVPVYMTYSTSNYYCARIDYGYSRNNTAHILFTDREQRQWRLDGVISGSMLNGTLTRVSPKIGMDDTSLGAEYLLPQDRIFASMPARDDISQIMMTPMNNNIEKSLDCLYYFKATDLSFILPDDLDLSTCQPSTKDCQSLKLAIIGSSTIHRLDSIESTPVRTIVTAQLDDCDIIDGSIRRIKLRDNPHVFSSISSQGLFFATAIIFRDDNMNGEWDAASETVLAALDGQTLIFYDKTITESVYGRSVSGNIFELPVITPENMNEQPGWYIFNDESETSGNYRVIQRITTDSTMSLALRTTSAASDDTEPGCRLKPENDSQTACTGIIPLLYQ